MANVLGTRPIVIDTPGATVLLKDWLKISNIVWTSYTADAHTFEIQNAAGDKVYEGNGESDLAPIELVCPGWIKGLKVPTLQSGKLFIYIE